MRLASNVFDVWAFKKSLDGAQFLLMYTSSEKAQRYFNSGRFWQIPSGFVEEGESITDAVERVLALYGLSAKAIWAGEHAYIIYNRRFAEMQVIGVYAAEVTDAPVRLDPSEHSEYGWFPVEACLERVHYRGLKEGARSVRDYVTGCDTPAKELCLYESLSA
jgi:ADP-ribose pyrophosphatase YjhB (NUDIX family)